MSLDVSSVHGPPEVSGTLSASRVADPAGFRRVVRDTEKRVELVNAAGPARAHGGELFAVYNQEPVIVTAFHAATRMQETSPETGRLRESPYVPTTSAGLDAAFEEDESGTRAGVEVFYTGRQAVEENPYRSVAPAYVTVGLLLSQQFGRARVFLNLDNLTNVRQSRWDPLLRPTPGEGPPHRQRVGATRGPRDKPRCEGSSVMRGCADLRVSGNSLRAFAVFHTGQFHTATRRVPRRPLTSPLLHISRSTVFAHISSP